MPSPFEKALFAQNLTGFFVFFNPSSDRASANVASGNRCRDFQDEFAILLFRQDQWVFHSVKAELATVGAGKSDGASLGDG